MPARIVEPGVRAVAPQMLLGLLTGYIALQPLSTDIYLPSLPELARAFDAPVSTVQLTLSVFIAGFGLAQLLVGPLSDRFGRLPVISGGIALYVAASIAAALAPGIAWLIACRFLQAIGACAGLVGARAIVRDSFSATDGAHTLARANTLMSVVPLAGPALGGWLAAGFSFRAVFVLLAVYGAALLFMTLTRLRETNRHRDPEALRPARLLANYRTVAAHPSFWAYALSQTASYAGLFAFISGSSFVLIRILGATPQRFGILFGATVGGYVLGSLACQRLLPRLGMQRTLRHAALVSLAGGMAMVMLALTGVHALWAIVVPQAVCMFAHGLITPCAQAGAVAPFARQAGTAAALMGLVLSLTAALVGLWIGASFNGTVYPMTLTIGGASLAVFAVIFGLVRRFGDVSQHA